MNLARSFILMIGDDSALLAPLFGSNYIKTVFTTGHNNEQALPVINTLLENPHTPVLIIADTLSQEYRREVLPRLNFLDRKKLLKRRLDQYFPGIQLSAAFPLKNGAALFACLHDVGPLAMWMRRIESLSNIFAGIAPLPLACADMIKQLAPETQKGWAMLLSLQRTGGFRQIVTLDGNFVFTRLTPPLPVKISPANITTTLALDIKATLDYLTRLGFTNKDSLRLIAIMPESMHEAVNSLPFPVQALLVLSPLNAAKCLGLSFTPDKNESYSDLVYAAWIAKKNPSHAIMLPEEKKKELLAGKIRQWGFGAAFLLWLAVFSHFWIQGQELFQLARKLHQTTTEIVLAKKQLAEEQVALTPTTKSLALLRKAVSHKRIFSELLPSPWSLLEELNKIIKDSARVTHLDWRIEKDEYGKVIPSLRISLRLTEQKIPSTTNESGRQAIIKIFDRLAETMRSDLTGYKIAITRYPFLIKPDETLTNSGNSSPAEPLPIAELLLRKEKP